MRKKGFTLIELLVALTISSLILLFIYSTYTGILFNFKDITKQSETQTQTIPALNVLRLDLEHAGYGLDPSITGNKPLNWDNSSKTLTIKSTINTTNNKTIGWILVKCDDVPSLSVLSRSDNSTINNNSHVVWMDAENDNKWVSNGTAGTCPKKNAVLLGFPYDNSTTNGCTVQFCNKIQYNLSASQNVATCNSSTRNLLRSVGSLNGIPILNCVGGFEANIVYDNATNPKPVLTNVYILLQEGQKDRKYNFGNASLTMDNVTFNLTSISDYKHYRWKIIKLSVKPMAEYRSYP